MSPDLSALYLANAVMFRRFLHILIENSGSTAEERANVHKQLFEQIIRDLQRADGPPQYKNAAEKIVMGIFGIAATGRVNN